MVSEGVKRRDCSFFFFFVERLRPARQRHLFFFVEKGVIVLREIDAIFILFYVVG